MGHVPSCVNVMWQLAESWQSFVILFNAHISWSAQVHTWVYLRSCKSPTDFSDSSVLSFFTVSLKERDLTHAVFSCLHFRIWSYLNVFTPLWTWGKSFTNAVPTPAQWKTSPCHPCWTVSFHVPQYKHYFLFWLYGCWAYALKSNRTSSVLVSFPCVAFNCTNTDVCIPPDADQMAGVTEVNNMVLITLHILAEPYSE